MSIQELIEKIKTAFLYLAHLQKSDLKDPNEMQNYNTACSQIIIIKQLIPLNIEPNTIIGKLKYLQKNALAELKSELPKMIDENKMEQANRLYEEIKADIQEIIDVYENYSSECRAGSANLASSMKN